MFGMGLKIGEMISLIFSLIKELGNGFNLLFECCDLLLIFLTIFTWMKEGLMWVGSFTVFLSGFTWGAF